MPSRVGEINAVDRISHMGDAIKVSYLTGGCEQPILILLYERLLQETTIA